MKPKLYVGHFVGSSEKISYLNESEFDKLCPSGKSSERAKYLWFITDKKTLKKVNPDLNEQEIDELWSYRDKLSNESLNIQEKSDG